MEKLKRILAILAIISLVFCALLTLVFALLTNFGVGDFTNAWRASAWSSSTTARTSPSPRD